MLNFKLSEEMNDVINMSRAMGQRKKSESPYTAWMLKALSYEGLKDSWRVGPYKRFMYDMPPKYC